MSWPAQSASDVERPLVGALRDARTAQAEWARRSLSQRLRVVRRVRHRLAEEGCGWAVLMDDRRDADVLAGEVIPLADACRFLEREARRILRAHRPRRRGRPGWLAGVDLAIEREPLGVVLVIAPSNGALFLPGVMTLQALVAGNAVVLKPGRGGSRVAGAWAELLRAAGACRATSWSWSTRMWRAVAQRCRLESTRCSSPARGRPVCRCWPTSHRKAFPR